MKSLYESIMDIDKNIDGLDKSIKQQIKEFLKANFRGTHKVSTKPNNDGKYEVSAGTNVSVKNLNIESLTNGSFVWTEIKGDFVCMKCKSLKSLEGGPRKVEGNFECQECDSLISLEGAPEEVDWGFNCYRCKSLESLKGAPKRVNLTFNCSDCNLLTSLEGISQNVGSIKCTGCKSLKSLKGSPNEISSLYCYDCISLKTLEGVPKKIYDVFNCRNCGGEFSRSDVQKYSNAKEIMV